MYDEYWNKLTESLWSPESWIKVTILLVTAPIWLPVLRLMMREAREVLAPEGGLYANKTPRPIARRAPGEDPFLSIPLASERRLQRAASTERSQRGTVHPAAPPSARRARFRGGAVHDVNRGATRRRHAGRGF